MNRTATKALLEYYHNSILEELKTSALKNIKADKNNLIIELPSEDKVVLRHPQPVEYPHLTEALTNMKIKAELDKTKQIIYGLGLVEGYVNKKHIYAPLIHVPCVLERRSPSSPISIKPTGDCQINMSILASVMEFDTCTAVVKEIQDIFPEAPITKAKLEAFVNGLTYILPDEFNSLNITLNRNFLVLANFGKITSGILQDYASIKEAVARGIDYDFTGSCEHPFNFNSLFPVAEILEGTSQNDVYNRVADDKMIVSNIEVASPSQAEIIKTVGKGNIMSIQGGPGTGKSTTIVNIMTHLVTNGAKVLVASKSSEAVSVLVNKYNRAVEIAMSRIAYGEDIDCSYRPRRAALHYLVNDDKATRKVTAGDLRQLATNGHKTDIKNFAECTEELVKVQDLYEKLQVLDGKVIAHSAKALDYKNFDPRKLYHQAMMNYNLNKIRKNPYSKELIDYSRTKDDILGNYREMSFLNACLLYAMRAKKDDKARRALLSLALIFEKDKIDVRTNNYGWLYQEVMEICPVCFTTINNVAQAIPCISGLYDYVIIDEASQCDIASTLPLLFRAKKAIIVGDDKQLKFLSFIDKRFNEVSMDKVEQSKYTRSSIDHLDNRKNSLYDFAVYFANGGVTMLKEYFRSDMRLIEFANREFYSGQLTYPRISLPRVVGGDNFMGEVHITKVKGAERDSKKGCNYKEAERVVDIIVNMIRNNKYYDEYGEYNVFEHLLPTIGVVTPFRAQAELINKMIHQRLTLQEITKHSITVGTAHSFQGNEKNVMIASWGVTNNSPVQSFTFINNPNLFNVAITRASMVMINVVSMDICDIPQGLLRSYLEMYGLRPVRIDGDVSNV